MREEAEPATDAARLLGGLLCETLPAGISQWKFHSCEVRRVWFHHCAWIQYINRFHEYFSWEVPEYWYLAGVIRHHGNGTSEYSPRQLSLSSKANPFISGINLVNLLCTTFKASTSFLRASEPLCRWENRSASGSSRNPVFACSEGQSLMVWVPGNGRRAGRKGVTTYGIGSCISNCTSACLHDV
ncbi:uncharacterized protein [Narcine bancroftii]|uniref:uncharacterized protein isoform X3 n=1 Tax=Narcine bancroftii TaxID=1343680 RepID=UPI0038310EC1